MSYLTPAEFIPLLSDAGARKISMDVHKVMSRAFMAVLLIISVIPNII